MVSLNSNSHSTNANTYGLIRFSIRFCSLTKESGNRPKYAELLQSDFIKKYDTADVDVASWLASVMQPKQQKSELHR